MDKELYKIAAQACSAVYAEHIDLGTTEYRLSSAVYRGEEIRVLAFAGTNEIGDWGKNIDLRSRQGIKKGAIDSALETLFVHPVQTKLLVCGHSRGGAAAIAYKRVCGADWCVAFCPSRCLRYWVDRRMDNTTIFTDPDDLVAWLAMLSFGFPICKRVRLPNDAIGWRISDHFMTHIDQFLQEQV